jgi:hypothetical protein
MRSWNSAARKKAPAFELSADKIVRPVFRRLIPMPQLLRPEELTVFTESAIAAMTL